MLTIIEKFQQQELTDHHIYLRLARKEKNLENKEILNHIALDELTHYGIWKEYTKKDLPANKIRIFLYSLLSLVFGFTFTIKLMEKNEYQGGHQLHDYLKEYPKIKEIIKEEEEHENALIAMLNEERLNYVGSIVLGLNDALVELTGTIAGLTFAFSNNQLVALSGIITGIAATLSMAASNYLAQKAEGNTDAFKSSLYTGIAYLITVVLLVIPYLVLPNNMYLQALLIMIAIVIMIILIFNYYISIAKEMLGIDL
ncbi:MAG: VIT1/CCC1 family protein [Bacilli bacterium]|jgi:VIT1/CCC1 family predicted Fe2+/Mn2+ transporter|nr:VIT1/CCC1 family protein [Bacilli bacterium]